MGNIIGIDLGIDKVQVAFFDNTRTEPIIIFNGIGYEILLEDNIENIFKAIKLMIGNKYSKEAIVAVPGYFNNTQRKAIKNIAEKNGITIKRLIQKSSALALAFGFDLNKTGNRKENLTVLFVVEKGLLEVALANMEEGVIEICNIAWDNHFYDSNLAPRQFNDLCTKVMADIKLSVEQIDNIGLACTPDYLYIVQPLIKNYFKKDIYPNLNVDNATVVGTAIQCGISSHFIKDMILLDVIPISLGIETPDGEITRIIPKNTTIPTRKGHIISINVKEPGQCPVGIKVYQGEHKLAADFFYLGIIDLSIHRIGKFEIEICFDVDAYGMLHISAKDLGTGEERSFSFLE